MKKLTAEADAAFERQVAEIESETAAVVVSGSDEETPLAVVIEPEHLVLGGRAKKTKGGQKHGVGRARATPMFFDPENWKDEQTTEEFEDRIMITNVDMVDFFEHEDIQSFKIDAFLVDLPYGTQPENHAQDPPLTNETVRGCAKGMWARSNDACVAVLGCGDIHQVLPPSLLFLLACCTHAAFYAHTRARACTHTHTVTVTVSRTRTHTHTGHAVE